MLQALKANLMSNTWRVSGELVTSHFSVICHLHNLGKNIYASRTTKILQNLWLTQIILKIITTLYQLFYYISFIKIKDFIKVDENPRYK